MFSHEPLSEDTKELLDKVSMSIVNRTFFLLFSYYIPPRTVWFNIITDVG